MNLLSEISPPPLAEDRSFSRLDGKAKQKQLEVHPLLIPDVKLIRTPRISDARGYFCETFQRADFAAQRLDIDFLQDNQSHSYRPGTVPRPALSTAAFRADEAGSCPAREYFRCGCRSSPFVIKLWKAYCRKAEQRGWRATLYSGRLCPWLLHARARYRRLLQGRSSLFGRSRRRGQLGRSRIGD